MGVGQSVNSRAHRAVFLDRDGVLDRAFVAGDKPHPPVSVDQLEILPGVREALAALKAKGLLLVVVTNQPDVARGTIRRDVVEAINAELMQQLPLDDIRVCYHDDPDNCDCRKPRPGMLLQAAEKFGIDLSASFMVGDRMKDVEAGKRAGCQTILIDLGYAEPRTTEPDNVARSIDEAARWILDRIAA
jgi:D-glycero-D-manno-heptose 1,7-bisphosphate phosphatase